MALDAKRVQKPVRKLRKILKRISRQPSQDEVHDLRTNTRRLEATLSALSLEQRGEAKRLLRDISRVRKRAGKVRDMDVLTAFAASLTADRDRECKVRLLEHLGARRNKLAKRLHARIAKRRQSLRERLKGVAYDLDRATARAKDRQSMGTAASSQAAASALALQSELAATPRHLGRKNLHPYRLKVKELRNVLRMARQEKDSEFIEKLGAVKDAIGEWHDWQELLAMAQKVLNHGSKCDVLGELKKTANGKYDDALRAAEDLRRNYLRVSRDGRKVSGRLPAKSVSSAIANIAA
jgi:CHAD domain-containing protein